MKKKILSLIGITMIVLFSVFSLTFSNKGQESDLQLKNLIAMSSAQAEGQFNGIWRVTILSMSSWRCDSGGSMCCLDFDC